MCAKPQTLVNRFHSMSDVGQQQHNGSLDAHFPLTDSECLWQTKVLHCKILMDEVLQDTSVFDRIQRSWSCMAAEDAQKTKYFQKAQQLDWIQDQRAMISSTGMCLLPFAFMKPCRPQVVHGTSSVMLFVKGERGSCTTHQVFSRRI